MSVLGSLIVGWRNWWRNPPVGVLTMRSYELLGPADSVLCIFHASFEFEEVIEDDVELTSFLRDRTIHRVAPIIPVSFKTLARICDTYIDNALNRRLLAENSLAKLRTGKLFPREEEKFEAAMALTFE